jgi:hypothetical protein
MENKMDKASIKKFVLSVKKILLESAQKSGYESAAESMAYLWFMRIVAVHYMSVNGFLPRNADKADFFETCKALKKYLPEFFFEAEEFVFPHDVIKKELLQISDAFINKPEIIGTLHQYFIEERKSEVFNLLKSNIRVSKEDLPAATQIFTPRWLVEYLVQNSLGAFCEKPLQSWRYFVKGSQSFQRDVKNIKLIDPCMGSANILLYAFDVFIDLYKLSGVKPEDAASIILKNNLYGLEIDERAYRIAYFSLIVKARSYDENIFCKKIPHNLCEIQEDDKTFKNAKLYGSLLNISCAPKNPSLKRQALIMSQKYDVVVTNPPYMGRKSLNSTLAAFLHTYYPQSKSELYSAFIVACIRMLNKGGICAMLTIHTWMFISSFEKLRRFVLENTQIISMLHTGAATFEELRPFNALSTAFCLKKCKHSTPSIFIRLTDYLSTQAKIENFAKKKNRFIINQHDFSSIPKSPFVYWLSHDMKNAFSKNKTLGHYCKPRQGLATGDNKRFVRRWYEVEQSEIGFGCVSICEFHASGKKYAPYNKGGGYRKWYGNNEYIIKFDKESFESLSEQGNHLPSRQHYFKEGITWSLFGFENFSVRYKPSGFVFDVSGSSMFPEDNLKYILAFLSSNVAFSFLSAIAPTVNFQVGNISSLPFKIDETAKGEIEALADENIALVKQDWDSFEVSWDFVSHPLARQGLISEAFKEWEITAQKRYNAVLANEKRMNEIFAKIYGVRVDSNVQKRDVSVATADLERDIRTLVSYATGWIFGRFSQRHADLLSMRQITDLFIDYIDTAFGRTDENLAFISKALGGGCKNPKEVIFEYYSKHFFKHHYKAYKKCPIYWQISYSGFDGLLYMHNYNSSVLEKLGCAHSKAQHFKMNKDAGIVANYESFFSILPRK